MILCTVQRYIHIYYVSIMYSKLYVTFKNYSIYRYKTRTHFSVVQEKRHVAEISCCAGEVQHIEVLFFFLFEESRPFFD